MQKISNLLNIVTAASPYWMQYNYGTWRSFNETAQNAQNTGELGRLFPGHVLEKAPTAIKHSLPPSFAASVPISTEWDCQHIFASLQWYDNAAAFDDKHVIEYQTQVYYKALELLKNATEHGKQYGVTIASIGRPTFFDELGGVRMVGMLLPAVWRVRECVEIVKYTGMAAPQDIGSVDFERVGIV
jgi:hypothetical protein